MGCVSCLAGGVAVVLLYHSSCFLLWLRWFYMVRIVVLVFLSAAVCRGLCGGVVRLGWEGRLLGGMR